MVNIRLRYNRNIGFSFQTISKYAKCDNSIILKFFIYLTFSTEVLLMGCLNTEGTLEIKGKVIDEYTKLQIPGREIIVQGLVEYNEKLKPIDAGQFSTDSSGNFTYLLRKVKDARFYNFFLVGDSDYSFKTKKLGLLELEQNAKFLFFSLNKLADLRIKIYNKSKTHFCDTLYLSWESNGVDFRILYPYKIDNFGTTDNFIGLTSYSGLIWIGGNTNSIVKTRVFADKMTKMHWELVRNKTRKEITDTITCKRDLTNIVYFTY
jgi:hypothetical protein